MPQVINACQSANKTAVNQPSGAIRLAKGSMLRWRRCVLQREIGKGEAGARDVIDNADAISRAAQQDLGTKLPISRSLITENAYPMPTAAAQL